MGENRGGADGVAASLDGAPAHQIDPAAKALFEVLLECAHLEKADFAAWQKINQEIYVAPGLASAMGRGRLP